MFIYYDDNNESDIEILTSDPSTHIRYSNQPTVDKGGNLIAAASNDVTLPKDTDWTAWNEHRIDWLRNLLRGGTGTMSVTASATKRRPLGDRVVVRPVKREEVTKSGIVLPDTAQEKPQRGMIVAKGKGRMLDNGSVVEIDLNEGDEVLYAKYAGTEFKMEDEELLVISEKDILAVVGK